MIKRSVSIIIPVFNEEANIAEVQERLNQVIKGLPYDFEFIFVDNSSTDQTLEKIRAICRKDPRWKYIRFTRNFSLEMSIAAGYRYASGEAMIVLYSDLQDPPEVIPEFLKKWEEGYDVVYGVRTRRPGDPQWRNALISLAYRLIGWLSDVPIPVDAGDFRLISREVREALDRCGEVNRYTRGLISWLGFRQTGVPYQREARRHGKSKFPFWNLFTFTLDAITSFSLKPLRLFTLAGFCILLLCLLASPFYLTAHLWGTPPPGIITIIGLLLIAIGINSLGIGILGEYLGRTYAEVKHRPLYLVRETMNLEVDKK